LLGGIYLPNSPVVISCWRKDFYEEFQAIQHSIDSGTEYQFRTYKRGSHILDINSPNLIQEILQSTAQTLKRGQGVFGDLLNGIDASFRRLQSFSGNSILRPSSPPEQL